MRLLIIAALLLIASSVQAQLYVRQGGLSNEFNCTMISTATSLTEITGCSAPAAGVSRFITGIQWSSSIISTTTNYMLIRSGTGTNCGSSTTSLWAGFVATAFGFQSVVFVTPIKATAAHALCFIHPGAGTRNVNLQGFMQ